MCDEVVSFVDVHGKRRLATKHQANAKCTSWHEIVLIQLLLFVKIKMSETRYKIISEIYSTNFVIFYKSIIT